MKSKIVNGLLGLTKQVSRNAGFVLAVLYTAVPGTAKSADIPLVLVQLYDKDGTAFYRLGINVGIGSGKPKTYLFDTGSSLFNAAYSPAWWPSSITPTTAPLAASVKYKYGDKNSFVGNIIGADAQFLCQFHCKCAVLHAAESHAWLSDQRRHQPSDRQKGRYGLCNRCRSR